MPSRASRRAKRTDPLQIAVHAVQKASGEVSKPTAAKNVHAQALSALGASKGGLARAAKLSERQRRAIAKKAAAKRWGKS
jgi:hypothetical protein